MPKSCLVLQDWHGVIQTTLFFSLNPNRNPQLQVAKNDETNAVELHKHVNIIRAHQVSQLHAD